MEEGSFERKILNCTLVLLRVQDQIKQLDARVSQANAREAHEGFKIRRSELTAKEESLRMELSQLQAEQREFKAKGPGLGENLGPLRPS
jgi:ABC-type phosphate transport system auxiliary subunit